jgi:hypothetical protein
MSKGRERELKYLYTAALPPQLPAGWSISAEEPPLALRDTYLDADGALAARGWALRRREGQGVERRYTLKRDATTTGALHSRDENEAVALGATGEIDLTELPQEIRSAIEREFGPHTAARLRTTTRLAQQRRSWTLAHQGATVAVMTIDQITADGTSWGELEIEFDSSLSDLDVERFVQELNAALEHIPEISVSAESKGERARRLSL